MPAATVRIASVAATLGLLLPTAVAQGFYDKGSPVLELANSREYDDLIARSNHTSIVEFYAPWCGHCRNLKPAYEKAAQSLAGLAKVAAVNCDEEANKPFCGSMGVKGFPTLKIVKPGKRPGKPSVEDYQGARTAKGISDAVKDKIPNNVKRLTDDTLQTWLADANDTAKAILFTTKGATSALIKALAIDFLGTVNVAQARDKEKAVSHMFGVTDYPTFVLLPGADAPPSLYTGTITKPGLVEFLSAVAAPNPDPAPSSPKPKSKGDGAPQKPIVDPDSPAPKLTSLEDPASLQRTCLSGTSGICVLVMTPKDAKLSDLQDEATSSLPAVAKLLQSLAEIQHHHKSRNSKIPPFYVAPLSNSLVMDLGTRMHLKPMQGVVIVAVNGKRGWLKRYRTSKQSSEAYEKSELESWIEAIKLGEGRREDIPEALISRAESSSQPSRVPDASVESETDKGREAQGEARDATAADSAPDPVSEPIIDIAELSDEEVERLLGEHAAGAKPEAPQAPDHGEL